MAANVSSPKASLAQHVVYICSRLIAYGLPLLFFLILDSFYLKTYDSAQIKITFMQIGGAALAILWFLKMIASGKWPFTRQDLGYIAPFLAFLISGIIVWMHTPFKAWSLEETLRRVFYALFALLAISEFQTSERMSRLFRWLILTAWTVVGYGLVQYIDSRFFTPPAPGIDPFIWRGAFGPRVFSTFGNPNFYGNFLVIVTPLALAAILRAKGSMGRPFLLVVLTALMVVLIDKMMLHKFGGIDPSLQIVFAAVLVALAALLFYLSVWNTGSNSNVALYLLLMVVLFVNLYSTETKGAWVGFIAAVGATSWLIFEYFLRFDEFLVETKKYLLFLSGLIGAFSILFVLMFIAFVLPWLQGKSEQIGFQILWIPSLLALIITMLAVLWLMKKPWNLKKVVYGVLLFFIVAMGAGVLQFAKQRLVSISFRMFTWISTWEMVRTNPILGNGVGTFKIIYPAFRRPEIIALEARSNTETDHAEDEYLEVWQDEGIVGFGVFLWMVFTAIFLGFKQLNWYARHRFLENSSKKKLFDIDNDPRSYEVLGYLGAYIGASIHWFFDVSIRFVSSGIFSGLLPGVLVAHARNLSRPTTTERVLTYDRWIRVAWAAFWTLVLCVLRVELVPQSMIQSGYTPPSQIYLWCILAGLFIFFLLEAMEWKQAPATVAATADALPGIGGRFVALRWLALPVILFVGSLGIKFGCDQFWGDVHHNLAIFFSKEAIWTKSPQFDAKILNFPQDIRDKYEETGGALDHYQRVVTLNHAFPMAHYFMGNVYNDWGSQVYNDSIAARARHDTVEAERLRDKALEMWDKAETAYTNTKKLAPNYVQTHHQMGLLDIKRAELYRDWNDPQKSQMWYQRAYDNFELYRKLDPVFPPNYDRLVQLLLMRGKTKEAIDLYKQAIKYNFDTVYSIHHVYFADRAPLAVSLAKLYYQQVAQQPNPFSPPTPEVLEAIKYFELALKADPANLEALKGLGFLYDKIGKHDLAQASYREALKLSPNDPDLKTK
jgi:tetratricopeptide (TPR) repeat protein/O-antigen ligase